MKMRAMVSDILSVPARQFALRELLRFAYAVVNDNGQKLQGPPFGSQVERLPAFGGAGREGFNSAVAPRSAGSESKTLTNAERLV